MRVPSRQELRRLFGEGTGERVHFAETVLSWPSLRILDLLYAEEPLSTGEIARELNVDMRDAKDILEALESWDIVSETDGGWRTAVDRVTVGVGGDDGIDVECTVAESPDAQSSDERPAYLEIAASHPSEPETAAADPGETATPESPGVVGRIVERLKRWVR